MYLVFEKSTRQIEDKLVIPEKSVQAYAGLFLAAFIKSRKLNIQRTMDIISELKSSHVHIKDIKHVNQVIQQIINDGPDKLQITADFDRTLTKHIHKGKICATCHNVLEEGGVLPENYKRKALELRDTYFPMETNPHLSIEDKIPLMVEWWTKAHDLLLECGLEKSGIRMMVQNSTAMLRDGATWLFDELNRFEIPVLIFSAGIGDVIEEILHEQATWHDNMKIVSNYIDFDPQGKMVGFKGEMIHVYNKNEGAVHDSDYFTNLEHRYNVILMGDSLGDLHMADGAVNVQNKLKIGFLNVKVEESLELYKNKYDIVIVQDETLDIVNALMRRILEKKTLRND